MKKLLFILALLITAITVNAQEPADTIRTVFLPEEMPEFPGGEAALMKFISTNIKYPAIAKSCECQGKLYVGFVIAADGSVKDVKIVRGATCNGTVYLNNDGEVIIDRSKEKDGTPYNCAEAAKLLHDEAIRVIKLMPKWKPGKLNGKPVDVQYNIPINFYIR